MMGDINKKMKDKMQKTADDEKSKRRMMKMLNKKMGKDIAGRMDPNRDESVEVT